MIINLVQIENNLPFDLLIEPSLVESDDEIAGLTKPLQIIGQVTKKLVQVDIEGKISGEIELVCSRCLENAATNIENNFKVAFVTNEFFTAETEAELNEEDLDVSLYDGETIDLIELAREQMLLEVPTHFVCKLDCKGLCPKCGNNLNNQNCNCETKEIDPRWQSLRQLKIKD
jgi:uncharacterized protein